MPIDSEMLPFRIVNSCFNCSVECFSVLSLLQQMNKTTDVKITAGKKIYFSFFLNLIMIHKSPFPAGRAGTLHDTFGSVIRKGKVVSLPSDFRAIA